MVGEAISVDIKECSLAAHLQLTMTEMWNTLALTFAKCGESFQSNIDDSLADTFTSTPRIFRQKRQKTIWTENKLYIAQFLLEQ